MSEAYPLQWPTSWPRTPVSFDVIPENIDAVKAREHSHA